VSIHNHYNKMVMKRSKAFIERPNKNSKKCNRTSIKLKGRLEKQETIER